MEVASDASTLLLPGQHQLLPRALEIRHHAHAVDRHACVMREVVQQAPVGGTELLARRARPKHQLADHRSLIGQGQVQRIRERPARGSDDLKGTVLGEPDGHIRQPERFPNRRHDAWQHGVRRQRRLEPLAQPRDHPVGLIALAVHQAVHPPLEPFSQGREERRHDTGRDE